MVFSLLSYFGTTVNMPSPGVVHLNPSFAFNLTRSLNYPFPPSQNIFKLKNPAFKDSNSSSLHQPHLKISTKSSISSSTAVVEDTSTSFSSASSPQPHKQKLGVVVKPMKKPKLVLKFIWMEKNIGIAVDQVIPGHGTIPLSPYYFWPRKDAWEELKVMLESKAWVTQKETVILLNQATDIINLWQQSGGDLS